MVKYVAFISKTHKKSVLTNGLIARSSWELSFMVTLKLYQTDTVQQPPIQSMC